MTPDVSLQFDELDFDTDPVGPTSSSVTIRFGGGSDATEPETTSSGQPAGAGASRQAVAPTRSADGASEPRRACGASKSDDDASESDDGVVSDGDAAWQTRKTAASPLEPL